MVQFYYRIYRPSYNGTSYNYLDGLKSIHYKEQSNNEENMRFGSIYPVYLEFDVYYTSHPMITVGEIIRLNVKRNFDSSFEEQSTTNSYYVHEFQVYEVKSEGRNTYKVIAYDGLKKLDADYSARLRELNNNGSFPMTLADFLTDVASVAGLDLSITGLGNYAPESLNIKGFYSDNLTCRDIMSWYVELVGGVMVFGTYDNNLIMIASYARGGTSPGYTNKSSYIICPTDQTTYYDDNSNELIPVFYKQDGLKDLNVTVQPVDQVIIIKSDGSVYGKYPYTVNNPTNIYYLSGNPLVDLLQDTANGSYVANRLKTSIDVIFSGIGNYLYKTAEITLFPFRYPDFSTTNIVTVEDTSGVRWRMPIMSIDITDEEVRIGSYGNATYESVSGAYSTADQKVTSLDIRVNNLEAGGGGGGNYVSKSGDTMTGNLTMSGAEVVGNSQTASKWQTARTLTVGNEGKSVDGSGNVSFPHPLKTAFFGTMGASGADGWYKICTVSQTGYSDVNLNLLFTFGYSWQAGGLLYVHTRCSNGAAITLANLKWMYRYGEMDGYSDFSDIYWKDNGNNTWTLYFYIGWPSYGALAVQVLTETGTHNSQWDLTWASNHTKESSAPTGGYYATDGGISGFLASRTRYFNRLTSANQDFGNGILAYFHATGSMTTGKPPGDGHILHFGWDNAHPNWSAQLYIGNGGYYAGVRYYDGNTKEWKDWKRIWTEANTIPVASGGSGQTGSTSESTVGNIITTTGASSGISLVSAEYAQWGKVAQVYITFKKSSAVSSGTTTIGTLNSGKRPKIDSFAQLGWAGATAVKGRITTGGVCSFNGAISANENISFKATYILA